MKQVALGMILALVAPIAATAADTGAVAATTAAKFTIDTPIQDIVANEQGKAVIERNFPGLIARPEYEMFKAISLKALQPYSNGKITDEMLAKTQSELAAIQ